MSLLKLARPDLVRRVVQQTRRLPQPLQRVSATRANILPTSPALRGFQSSKRLYIPDGRTMARGGRRVRIGDVDVPRGEPKVDHLVPHVDPRDLPLTQSVRKTLRWIMQKEKLGQDVFLIGPPGSKKRDIAFRYAQLTNREVEYVCMTRDCTEGDLKQRREIQGGTVRYVDQCAVRAALHGRILILDNVQNCERNVLPLINNLLENREMALEDGRFLAHPKRYQAIESATQGEVSLQDRKLERVHPGFFVIAIGIPVPPFTGYPLDPPFRSRFQAKYVGSDPIDEEFRTLSMAYPKAPRDQLRRLLAVTAVLSLRQTEDRLPEFTGNLHIGARLLEKHVPTIHVIQMLYPHVFLPNTDTHSRTVFEGILRRFDLSLDQLGDREVIRDQSWAQLQVDTGTAVLTPTFKLALAQMAVCHSLGRGICLVGSKGSGKSTLVRAFCDAVARPHMVVPVYRDMSSRDLLQRRATTFSGDTSWVDSPLVEAMQTGAIAVLDGIESLPPGCLNVLERLLSNRSVTLPDGTHLLAPEHYDSLGTRERENVGRVHRDFSLIAIARPNLMGMDKSWITPEIASLLPFVVIPLLDCAEELALLQAVVPAGVSRDLLVTLIDISIALRESKDDVSTLAHSLSLRQLVKIGKHLHSYAHEPLYDLIHRVTMTRFAPRLVAEQLDAILEKHGVLPSNTSEQKSEPLDIVQRDATLFIGGVGAPIKKNPDPILIPQTLFFHNQRQLAVMRDLLKDWNLQEHLLLIGNQGVGKNKMIDYLLARLQRERQYIQLHRDTTVQSLTAIPVIKEGVLSYEDSPVVIAARMGHVLVVDEADKAPTHVVSILKSLVDDKEMVLGDGRRIVAHPTSPSDIQLHPEFRMVVLANRPGFPFLGNDFFREIGDVFSCHAIDNPDVSSEVEMLKNYGPNVPELILRKLANAFAELRQQVDEGQITYPYSTREIVNLARHMQGFPDEGLANVVGNVFDFDEVDTPTKDVITASLQRHGIPIATQDGFEIKLAVMHPFSEPVLVHEWFTASTFEAENKVNWTTEKIALRGDWEMKITPPQSLTKIEGRNNAFSELLMSTTLPSEGHTLDAFVMGSMLYAITTNPIQLHMINIADWKDTVVDLHEYFPLQRGYPSLQVFAGNANAVYLVNTDVGNVLFIKDGHRVSNITSFQSVAQVRVVRPFNTLAIYQVGKSELRIVRDNGQCDCVSLPWPIESVHCTGPWKLLVQGKGVFALIDADRKIYSMFRGSELSRIVTSDLLSDGILIGVLGVDQAYMLQVTDRNIRGFRLPAIPNPYANVIPCLTTVRDTSQVIFAYPSDEPGRGSLDVVDWKQQRVRRVPFDIQVPFTAKLKTEVARNQSLDHMSHAPVCIFAAADGCTGILDSGGHIHVLQTSFELLKRDLHAWRQLIGQTESNSLMVTVDDENGKAQEVSGGTGEGSGQGSGKGSGEGDGEGGGEGGSGGGAGMGDSPSTGAARTSKEARSIDELITNAKDDSESTTSISIRATKEAAGEVTEAVREMHDKAIQERMKEISMKEHDMQAYLKYKEVVQREIGHLRQLIESTQRKQKERVWLNHKSTGELDERKLVDGLVGDVNIYKQRGEEDPTVGSLLDQPKRIVFSFDLSASMSKFNSHDSRLQRSVEVALLVMQAFKGFEHKFRYQISGHSGDSASLEFVRENAYPKNEKEELSVLTRMGAHAQYCLSGDNTLNAIKHAISHVTKEESDEYFVVVLSDANITQYGIKPTDIAKALSSDDRVHAYIIFIGTLSDQAESLRKAIPGRAFICMDTKDLPQIMKRIFSGMMRANL